MSAVCWFPPSTKEVNTLPSILANCHCHWNNNITKFLILLCSGRKGVLTPPQSAPGVTEVRGLGATFQASLPWLRVYRGRKLTLATESHWPGSFRHFSAVSGSILLSPKHGSCEKVLRSSEKITAIR